MTVSCAGVRPVPLEIHIMAFDIVSFDARLQAMARPTYSGLVQASSQVTSDLLRQCFMSLFECYRSMTCTAATASFCTAPFKFEEGAVQKHAVCSASCWLSEVT